MYIPLPDTQGGWRRPKDARDSLRVAGVDMRKIDAAYELTQQETKNGGLFVLRRGWLVYSSTFGLGHPEATPNLASVGKSFTSIAAGILLSEFPDHFPDGLDQRVYTPDFLPESAFPLNDPRKARITLGQLLSFTAGIRGNNPGRIAGAAVTLDPLGPDGWPAMVDEIALGMEDGETGGVPWTTATLWCEPGSGYSYATASIHIVSMIVRRVAGMEMERYLDERLGRALSWGTWTVGYKHTRAGAHTSGGGGVAMRAADVLRFGYLLLHEGRWGGKQLVPSEYIRSCGRTSVYNPHAPYSLQFDVNTDGLWPRVPTDAYWKTGSGGHALYIVPSLDLVVWKLGGRDEQYSSRNTGLPYPETASPQERKRWTRSVTKDDATRRTLELVVEACE